MYILEVKNISKSFGSNKILDNLSFRVKEKTIYGFIGQNGAGKTTTMKIILGLLKADKGEVYVNKEKVTFGESKTNRFIGYLQDVPEFYGYMTPYEYLKLCGEITNVPKKELKLRIDELLKVVGLESYNKRINGFSRGMKQRLGIAQGLLNKPKLLICDEPTSALDPLGRKEILDILKKVKEETTVIFSTHILSDVESICDEIGLVNKGRLQLEGSLDDIKNIKKEEGFIIEFKCEEDKLAFLELCPFPEDNKNNILIYKKNSNILEAMRILYENKIEPIKLERLEPSLESLFMEVIKN